MPGRVRHPDETDAVEVAEIIDFLSMHAPFDAMPDPLCRYAARHLEIIYERADTTVLDRGAPSDRLYLIRTGAVELHDEEGTLVERLGEGEYFGYPSLLTESPAARCVTTLEDSLFYLIPDAVFDRLRSDSEAFDHFFNRAHAERVEAALREQRQQNVALTTRLASLIRRAPVCAPPDRPIREAAQQMTDARVSSLLIHDDSGLHGIITDRDVRRRVVARGHALDAPVASIMTPDPVTLSVSAYAFEALLVMSQHNIHHLPVMDDDGIAGMVTTTDLMRLHADNPVYLVGEVRKQESVEGLAAVSERLPPMVVHLVEADARADDTMRLVTAVTDAITERLLKLAEAELGPPPVPYAWVALGSQARREQTAHSDQDHALLLANEVDLDAHDAYFAALARFVADGLAACGYAYCPGEVMATNATWRQPIARWRRYFRDWIQEPSPKALMHASIFFDMRHLHGDATLTEQLRADVLEQTANNTIFLASLTVDALQFAPPLGFFRQFVLKKHGNQEKTLDLKHNGVVPAIDLTRIHALAHGVAAVNTHDRLEALADSGAMPPADADNLRDAFEFIALVRLRHQARQLRAGDAPDNFVSPGTLSDFERRHLKDAFKVVSRMQSALEQRYQTSLIR
jgi:CBS domain-containing protein